MEVQIDVSELQKVSFLSYSGHGLLLCVTCIRLTRIQTYNRHEQSLAQRIVYTLYVATILVTIKAGKRFLGTRDTWT